jgi:hypothetical protein
MVRRRAMSGRDQRTPMSSEASDHGGSQQKQGASTRWLRALIVYGIVFLACAAMAVFLGRHVWNFYQLQSGTQDRSLMAISAASLHVDSLEVSFIRSMPDQPSGSFVLAGHKPAHNQSDPEMENSVNEDTVTLDGLDYEILFESTDGEVFPDRSGLVPFNIEWTDRETGKLVLGPVNQRAINHITSFRAFLLLTKGEDEFYMANIAVE